MVAQASAIRNRSPVDLFSRIIGALPGVVCLAEENYAASQARRLIRENRASPCHLAPVKRAVDCLAQRKSARSLRRANPASSPLRTGVSVTERNLLSPRQ